MCFCLTLFTIEMLLDKMETHFKSSMSANGKLNKVAEEAGLIVMNFSFILYSMFAAIISRDSFSRKKSEFDSANSLILIRKENY